MAEKEAAEAAPQKKSKKMLVMMIAAVLLIGGGVGGFLMLSGGDAEAAPEEPELGAVVTVEPITINLADGHYLKLGFALQATAAAAHEPEPAIALDLAIAQYTDMKIAELSTAKGRAHAKEELLKKVEKAYHEEVVDIYFTQFVTQ